MIYRHHFAWNLKKYLWALDINRQNLRKNIKKLNSSEAVWGIKLKLCSIVYNISLYKKIAFYCRYSSTLVAMAIEIFHWLGKVKIEIYCYHTQSADILTKVLQTCSLSSPLPNIWILSKPLNLIGCHGNRQVKGQGSRSPIIGPVSSQKKINFF